ncbi:MAG: SDR family NAD(P)-dependent oxidoreductase, partial [Bacteroidia bacterium]|nr:SDR family NAD(P)-dependent oxidoreductase [Bacteroidia bacterium]
MSKEEKLRDKVVVITGASAGVGRATAREFAKYNTKVAVLARGTEGLLGAVREIEEAGSEGMYFEADVANYEEIEQAAQAVVETWGRIDIWVNNAMNSVFSPFSQVEPEEFRRVTEVTYLGQVYGTKVALKHMMPRNKG